jgi:ABC-type dipeptide/oligopeptide/nickel transport system permease component
MHETEYMGTRKAKVWTYLILAGVLIVGVVVGNFAISNPETAKTGVDAFMGLPGWAFPSIAIAVGVLVYLFGLKLETDWPEGLGALLVAGGVGWGEMMLGWENFELGGMAVLPYILPLVIFLLLMAYSLVRSR